VRPAGIVVAARGAATIYSMTFGPAGTPDAFALGNDGAIYAGRDAFQTGGVALATLGSGDPRAALVTHLGTALGARVAV
jgi:hypothetical protein